MRITTALWLSIAVALAVLVIKVPDWDAPRAAAVQTGFAPTGMVEFAPRAAARAVNRLDLPAIPPAAPGGPAATEKYKNVTVLTDLSAAEFDRMQEAMNAWVAPKAGETKGCAFCHDGNDFASDANPRKNAARKMLEMTRYVNSAWKSHVAPSGVTCFTCHRGQPVPADVWSLRGPQPERPMVARRDDWNESAETVYGFFPDAGFAQYYLQDNPVSAEAPHALTGGLPPRETLGVRRVYEMMMQMSVEIGANCTSCHNSRSFKAWDQSTPQRWVAFHALRMMRDLNRNHILPVANALPQTRELVGPNPAPVMPARDHGAQPGASLATCGTCHYGLPKPLGGAKVLKDFPALAGASPPSPEADPDVALTRPPIGTLQKPDLAAAENNKGALR